MQKQSNSIIVAIICILLIVVSVFTVNKVLQIKEVKRIGVLSALKVFALLGVVIGILSILQSILFKIAPAVALQMGVDASALTTGVILLSALMAIVVYAVLGLIGAALYNLIAKLVGGIKVKIE